MNAEPEPKLENLGFEINLRPASDSSTDVLVFVTIHFRGSAPRNGVGMEASFHIHDRYVGRCPLREVHVLAKEGVRAIMKELDPAKLTDLPTGVM